MIVLAFVLLLIAAVVVAGVLLSSPAVHDLSVFRVRVPVTDAGMFLAGAAVALLAVIAVILLRSGIRRSRARRRNVKAIQSARSGPSTTPTSTSAPVETSTGSTSRSSTGRTTTEPDPSPTSEPTSTSGEKVSDQPRTDPAERARLLAEADALTRDDPPR